MKYSDSTKKYYGLTIPFEQAPEDAITLTDEQLAYILAEKKAGNIIRYEGGQFVSYTPDNPPEDVKQRVLRQERNKRLAKCDWTQVSDSPMPMYEREKWADYRQALRDLPANTQDAMNPVWPTKPQ